MSDNGQPFFEVKNLKVSIDGNEILRGVDLTVNEGEIHAIMGRNGSGKSTMANVLMGHPHYEVLDGSVSYKGQDVLVRRLFGDQVADRVGPIWGFGKDDELRNMFMRTGQAGLWFIAGSLAQCRIFSKYLGLQIKACEEGLIPARRSDAG